MSSSPNLPTYCTLFVGPQTWVLIFPAESTVSGQQASAEPAWENKRLSSTTNQIVATITGGCCSCFSYTLRNRIQVKMETCCAWLREAWNSQGNSSATFAATRKHQTFPRRNVIGLACMYLEYTMFLGYSDWSSTLLYL